MYCPFEKGGDESGLPDINKENNYRIHRMDIGVLFLFHFLSFLLVTIPVIQGFLCLVFFFSSENPTTSYIWKANTISMEKEIAF